MGLLVLASADEDRAVADYCRGGVREPGAHTTPQRQEQRLVRVTGTMLSRSNILLSQL